jgi:hypothetical protein
MMSSASADAQRVARSVRYVMSVLLDEDAERFTLPHWFSYGPRCPATTGSHLHIQSSDFFGANYGKAASLPTLPLARIDETPLLYGEPRLERVDGALIVHADIIASAYFLLTRYEEWVRSGARDEHGRFPGRESLAYRAGFIDCPVVDEYARLLRTWARQVGIAVSQPRRRFSVLLTHDIDTIGPRPGAISAVRCFASGVLGRTPFRDAMRDATWAASSTASHPCDNLDDLIRLDARLIRGVGSERCRAAYFILAAVEPTYRGTDRLRSRLQAVARSGADIGLHASYEAGGDPRRIREERRVLQESIGTPVEKNRHHFLRWREPQDGVEIGKGCVHWDSTLGYADVAGFRLGVCRPLQLFDPTRQRLLPIEEHPLTVMDCTLDREMYMNLDEDAAFDYVRRLADRTWEHQGELVMLWHNTVLASTDRSYHRRLYPRLLDYLAGLLENARAAEHG